MATLGYQMQTRLYEKVSEHSENIETDEDFIVYADLKLAIDNVVDIIDSRSKQHETSNKFMSGLFAFFNKDVYNIFKNSSLAQEITLSVILETAEKNNVQID